jgi:hypothetical protein
MTVELQPIVVKAKVIADTQIVKPKLSTAIRVGWDVPPYSGDYTVTPTEETQTLETNGKRMRDNVTVEPIPNEYIIPSGVENIVSNGTYDITEKAEVNVNVPNPSSGTLNITENGDYDVTEKAVAHVDVAGLVPTGTLDITDNGTYDVTEKASAHVAVKQWDEELTSIIDGSATELRDLPSGLTRIKPYAFYQDKKSLPMAYQRVEYIQSVGNSYINTEQTATPYINATIDGEWVEYSSGFPTMLGTEDRSLSVGRINVIFGRGTGGFYSEVFKGQPTFTYSSYTPDNKRHTFNIKISETTLTLNVDGTINSISGQFAQQTNNPMLLFARGEKSGIASASAKFKLYGFTMTNGGEFVWDAVPCYRKSDGAIGLYNFVTNRFYENNGADDFIKGDNVTGDVQTIMEADLSVYEIGDYAFCNNDVNAITLRANQIVILGQNALYGCPISHIYVPSALVEAYKADAQWSAWANKISAIV